MYIALAIGIPLFLLCGGALLALAFHGEDVEQNTGVTVEAQKDSRTQQPVFLVLPGRVSGRRASFDELVDELESHLQREMLQAERNAASALEVRPRLN